MKNKLKNQTRQNVKELAFWMIMGQATNPQGFGPTWGYMLGIEDDLLFEALLTEFPEGPKQTLLMLYRCKVEKLEFQYAVNRLREFLKHRPGGLIDIRMDEIEMRDLILATTKYLDI